MKVSVIIIVFLVSTGIVNASLLDPVIENVVHRQAKKPPSEVPGIWKKKTVWKPRWIKEWKSAKVMKPVWRKIWSPVHIKEWVPIPKPPPGWNPPSTPLLPVNIISKSSAKDSPPLWDPVPYPESQQPPPPQNSQKVDPLCADDGCYEPSATGFSHSEISSVLGLHRYKKAPEYSQSTSAESVTHLTKVPPESTNWRKTRQSLHFPGPRFNILPEPPTYLVPPKLQVFRGNDAKFRNEKGNQVLRPKPQPIRNRPVGDIQITQAPGFQVKPQQPNSPYQWTPIQNRNKGQIPNHASKGHISNQANRVPPPVQNLQPGGNKKIADSNKQVVGKPVVQAQTEKPRIHADNNFIQQAELVQEYHYSEFDLQKKLNSQPTQPKIEEFTKPQQRPKEASPSKPTQKPVVTKTNPQPQPPPSESKHRQIRKDGHRPQQIAQNNPHLLQKVLLQQTSRIPLDWHQGKNSAKGSTPLHNVLQNVVNLASNHKFIPNEDQNGNEKIISPSPHYVHSTVSPESPTSHQYLPKNHKTAEEVALAGQFTNQSQLPPNHKFAPLNFNSTLVPESTTRIPDFKPIPIYEDGFLVVYPKTQSPTTPTAPVLKTTSQRSLNVTEDVFKTATAEPVTPLFVVTSSPSLPNAVSESTTEEAVFIVTPVSTGESLYKEI